MLGHQMSLELVQWQLLAAQRILDLLLDAGLVSALVAKGELKLRLTTSFVMTTTRRSFEHLYCPSVPALAGQDPLLLLLLGAESPSDETRGF